jgi:hypothetical protein
MFAAVLGFLKPLFSFLSEIAKGMRERFLIETGKTVAQKEGEDEALKRAEIAKDVRDRPTSDDDFDRLSAPEDRSKADGGNQDRRLRVGSANLSQPGDGRASTSESDAGSSSGRKEDRRP